MLVHILIRDDEFANEYTDKEEYREYDRHYIIESQEYTPQKQSELMQLLELYDEFHKLDYTDEAYEDEKYNGVADISKYNLLITFFDQFNNYFKEANEVYIG